MRHPRPPTGMPVGNIAQNVARATDKPDNIRWPFVAPLEVGAGGSARSLDGTRKSQTVGRSVSMTKTNFGLVAGDARFASA